MESTRSPNSEERGLKWKRREGRGLKRGKLLLYPTLNPQSSPPSTPSRPRAEPPAARGDPLTRRSPHGDLRLRHGYRLQDATPSPAGILLAPPRRHHLLHHRLPPPAALL